MKTFFKKPLGIFFSVAVVAILGIGTWFIIRPNSKPAELVEAKLGSISETVSVTGKVKAVQSVDLAFEKSGRVARVYANTGDKVRTGDTILRLDTTDAESAVQDAQTNLASAKLALDKIQGSAGGSTDQLNKAYAGGFDALNSTYTDSSAILDALNTILFTVTLDTSANRKNNIQYFVDIASGDSNQSFRTVPVQIKSSYDAALQLYNLAFADYKAIKGNTDDPAIVKALASSHIAETAISSIIKTATDVIRYVTDKVIQNSSTLNNSQIIAQNQSDLTKYGAAISSHITDLSSSGQTIANYGLDVKSQQIAIEQRENELSNAKNNLLKYSIYAPFNGVVTKEDAKVGEIVAPNVALVSLISESALEIEANISEVDIGKIKVNNPVIIHLDALPNKDFKGTVSFIDPAETVVDGVVNFKIKINFSENAELVKSGLTANLVIETLKKDNVIVLPQFAIVENDQGTFVRKVEGNGTKDVPVQLGIRGEDGSAEIISGVVAGEKVLNVAKATQ